MLNDQVDVPFIPGGKVTQGTCVKYSLAKN